MSKCDTHGFYPVDADRECPCCAELEAGYPIRPADALAPFVLQRDPGDEHRAGYHSHDLAARERDAIGPYSVGATHEAAIELPEHDATTDTKPTNPKDAFGVLKASLSFVSLPVLMETAVAMAEGGFKYGAHNYRVRGVCASVYVDATIRHVFDFWEGMDIDEESGAHLSHITKAIASLTVLRDSMIRGNWIDDRPPPSPKGWLKKISAEMVRLAEKFPQPVARYLANGKRGPGRILENGE
ncbi:hypothetical protein ABID65_007524 [Bradyrhizobium sp. S3.9.2]|uniref:dATP/dGTP diphosphohydrolase domain-containing protein n=1 Tax=Bradyrhizobium sp. S3.9.2 TaxID=3156432 RepID=UPI00339870A6